MPSTDQLIRAHLDAAARLVQQALDDAQRECPAGLDLVRRAIDGGALLTLRSTFAPTTGLAQLAIEVVEPNGTAHNLLSCDLEPESMSGGR